MTQVNRVSNPLAMTTQGDGPVVVLLHGLLGSSDNLSQMASTLAADHHVVSVDLPGHGASPHTGDYSLAAMADQLSTSLQALGITSFQLIGHSLGGKVAMQLSASVQQDSRCSVEKLIVIDIAPRRYPPHHADVFKALHKVPLADTTTRTTADKIMAQHINDSAVRAFLLKSLRRDPAAGWRWQFDLIALEKQQQQLAQAPEFAAPVACPTLFIKGALSDYLSAADEPLIRNAFTRPEFKIIAGAGHWPHAEKPAVCNRIVHRFLTN